MILQLCIRHRGIGPFKLVLAKSWSTLQRFLEAYGIRIPWQAGVLANLILCGYRSSIFTNPTHPRYRTSDPAIEGQKPRRGIPTIMAVT